MGPYYDHQVGRFEPLDPLPDRERLLARARRVRAEATAAMLAALWRRLTSGVAAFVRGAGAPQRPPRAALRHRHLGRLTASCN
jgi:hypothetical protein